MCGCTRVPLFGLFTDISALKSNLYSFMCLYKPVTGTLEGGLLLEVLNACSSFSFDVALSKCLTEQCRCDVEPHNHECFSSHVRHLHLYGLVK